MKAFRPQISKGPAAWFTGDVHPTIVLAGETPSPVRMGSVHFAPCARTAWHSHALGQYLHIKEGTALVQERNGGVQVLKPGDTIYTAPAAPLSPRQSGRLTARLTKMTRRGSLTSMRHT
jgi:quercetin dioxygenase-like cupin family protein